MPRLSQPRQRAAAPSKEPELEINNEASLGDSETPEISAEAQGDPTVALKEQIEALKRSEREAVDRAETERRRAEEANRRVQERDTEFAELREQTVTSQQEAVNAALVAAQAEAEAATRDIETASQLGDAKGQADAYRKLARAEGRILHLETGKEEIARQIEEAKKAPKVEPKLEQPRQLTREEQIDNLQVPPRAKAFFKENPQFMFDPRENQRAQAVHFQLAYENYEPYSKEYFEEAEYRLGLKHRQEELDMDQEDEPAPAPRKIVSAPPSREVPSSSGSRNDGRITLNRMQKEAAKIAGISEAEYAKQLMKLNEEKKLGNYGGGG